MAALKLTRTSKLFVTVVVGGVIAYATYHHYPNLIDDLFPPKQDKTSAVPLSADLPAYVEPSEVTAQRSNDQLPGVEPGCTSFDEVRIDLWAWNAQMGLMYAAGGPHATKGSLMCERKVNVVLIRQDDPAKMRADLIAFATELSHGAANPKDGAAFVMIMGDGSAAFLAELNAVLEKIGPEYRAKVVGSAGYSWGEDKFMGLPEWKSNPASARGGVVAGVLRDGDWNIAQKWLAENRLCNNPDERTFDPDCLNWVSTNGYVEAAEKYIAGYCEERPVVKQGKRTGEKHKVCVNGVVTWTPGDVMVAKKRGGLVSIVSTKEYRGQMPNVLIGIDKWMKSHRTTVEGLLEATFAGAENVKSDRAKLAHAAAISAKVYAEEDAKYWETYFVGTTEKDKTGIDVELGGSKVNTLADNLYLFGVQRFVPGATNAFAATYTVFGNVVASQYPELLARFAPASAVVDLAYLEAIASRTQKVGAPDVQTFARTDRVKEVVSRGSWAINFESGSARFSRDAQEELDELMAQLVIAGGMLVEVHGHTDASGDPRANMQLSEERAFAVKTWLERNASANFPEGRVRVFAHGQENPVASNSTASGRAKNRRVEIVLATRLEN